MHPCREGGRGGGASICQVNLIGCIQPEVAGKKFGGKNMHKYLVFTCHKLINTLGKIF